jgi:hypothetical protein
MGNVKPWQIVVFVLAFVAVGASAFLTLRSGDGPKLIDEITMVDVKTGQLFVYSLGGKKGVSVPETNPDTGARTLIPTYKDDTGAWVVSPRDRDVLKQFSGEGKLRVDSAGKVDAAPGAPRKVR